MSWLFSLALVEAFSEANSLDGERCAQLNVKPSAHPFWRNDKPMDLSQPSPFGLTCKHLTADRGEALLMSFLAAFRVRTSAPPARAPASLARGRDYGKKWSVSLAKFDRDSSSWKTAQHSLFEDSASSSVIWPRSGMTADGQCWELPTLELRTSEIDSGLSLPTPTASSYGSNRGGGSGREGQPSRPSLQQMAARSMWPTPRNNTGPDMSDRHMSLDGAVRLWPTPTATLGTKGGRVTPNKAREGGTLIEAMSARQSWPTPHGFSPNGRSNGPSGNELGRAVNQSLQFRTPNATDASKWSKQTEEERRAKGQQVRLGHQLQAGGSLNPTWVEWLMGWPLGWTDLKPLETDKYHSVQQPHGNCSQGQPDTDGGSNNG